VVFIGVWPEAGSRPKGGEYEMNLLFMLIAAAAFPALARIAGMMMRLLIEVIGGLVALAAVLALLLVLATHGKVL
jgi:hypothetical protein